MAERLASEAKLAALRLYTNARFVADVRFYARLGFENERETALNSGFAVCMTKRARLCAACARCVALTANRYERPQRRPRTTR